ncbi:unnamed protein product [Didymodactylos carnosus]|uniref:Uncharacterized protein n=1 Tax=Didymodactylos carnosus TaxID=1234261 RepID=A0A8S2CML1_9BILA|nr:unnamed protein product [Didymodactylos carnosus]CAF3529264.1 unnamed protein product [Didymodactylos carnosus]
MLSSSTRCEVRRTSVYSEIISIIEQALPSIPSHSILIGSRAARRHLPNFRGESRDEMNADWDIICSSQFLLQWFTLNDTKIETIDLIIPTSDGDPLDLYVCCKLTGEVKYDFATPRSSTSYTAYLLHNLDSWIHRSFWRDQESSRPKNASPKLLLILKKYMLHYSHQWVKTAKDYRQLLRITDPLTDEDKVLCDFFIRNNEKLHGQRPSDTDKFTITPYDGQTGITINREKFFQDEEAERLSCLYQAAVTVSIGNDILVGLEHICTRGPPWLADYAIDHLVDIQNEKFKHKSHALLPCIEFTVDNHRLFEQIPELAMQTILVNIADTLDFYSMQLVDTAATRFYYNRLPELVQEKLRGINEIILQWINDPSDNNLPVIPSYEPKKLTNAR